MSDHDSNLDSLQASLATPAPAPAPATKSRVMPGFIRRMPALIQSLFQSGVDFSMDTKGDLLIEGFYDNGPMRLVLDENDRVKAVDKRNKATPITSFDDLVTINFEWWKLTNAAAKGKKYTAPTQPWLGSFQTKNLVKRQVIFVENDGQAENLDD
jgi:hypothetical protein